MALITCPECGKKISNLAPQCISCGAPIGAAREAAVTTQLTSKRLKKRILISAIVFWVSIVAEIVSISTENFACATFSLLGMVASALIFIATKIEVWWHHK